MENDKLDFWQSIQKKSSQKGLSCINIYKFQAKWPSYNLSEVLEINEIMGAMCKNNGFGADMWHRFLQKKLAHILYNT